MLHIIKQKEKIKILKIAYKVLHYVVPISPLKCSRPCNKEKIRPGIELTV